MKSHFTSRRYNLSGIGWTTLLLFSKPNLKPAKTIHFVARNTLSSITIYTIYESLLTLFRTEALRKNGIIDRSDQINILKDCLFNSINDATILTISVSIIIFLMPWLSIPLSFVGLASIGYSSLELINSFWYSLSSNQREELLKSSLAAGINLRNFIDQKTNRSFA